MHICKESNRTECTDCVYISLCDYLWRGKSVQIDHLSWLSSCHRGLCSFSADGAQWKVLSQARCVSHIQYLCFCLWWCLSGWGPPKVSEAQHKCSLPPPLGGMLSDMPCLNKNLGSGAVLAIQLPHIPKVTESSIIFGQLWSLWGWSRRGGFEDVPVTCLYAQCLTHDFQRPLLAHAYISCWGRTSFQLFNSLFTAPWTVSD